MLLNEDIPVADVVRGSGDAGRKSTRPKSAIVLPRHIYGPERTNSLGRDISQAATRNNHAAVVAARRIEHAGSGPIIGGETRNGEARDMRSPADLDRIIGAVAAASVQHVDEAISRARSAHPQWDRSGGAARAGVLRRMADSLEAQMDRLVALLALEAGRSLSRWGRRGARSRRLLPLLRRPRRGRQSSARR